MLKSHNIIRFIIIDHGFKHKTVYKHSISNNNVHVLVLVHLNKFISFNKKSVKIKSYRCIKHRQNGILKTAIDTHIISWSSETWPYISVEWQLSSGTHALDFSPGVLML